MIKNKENSSQRDKLIQIHKIQIMNSQPISLKKIH